MLQRISIALLATAMAASGCATAYTPRPGPRLSVVMADGKPAYMRDGKTFEAGMFGGGLIDAVEGVPEAEGYAHSFRNRNVSGFAATLGGTGLVIGGMVLAIDGIKNDRSDRQQLAVGMLLGGLAVQILGAALMASAPPHQLDAINVYNDAVEEERELRRLQRVDPDELVAIE